MGFVRVPGERRGRVSDIEVINQSSSDDEEILHVLDTQHVCAS